jgi:hypothetical protein
MELEIAAAGDGDAAIVADGFTLQGAEASGPQCFHAVSFRARRGDLVLVTGQGSAARAGLLLALTGRLGPVGGTATVAGYDVAGQPSEVRRRSCVARISGSVEPGSWDLVGELVAGRPPAPVLLAELAGVDPQLYYSELSAVEQVLLPTSWALTGDPAVIVVHDADRGCTDDQSIAVWRALARVASTGVTVVASCVGAAPVAPLRPVARVLVPLPAPLAHLVDGRRPGSAA